MNWMGWTALGIGLSVVASAGLAAFGSSRWAGATLEQMALLEAAKLSTPAGRYDAREIDGMPAAQVKKFQQYRFRANAAVTRPLTEILSSTARTHFRTDQRARRSLRDAAPSRP